MASNAEKRKVLDVIDGMQDEIVTAVSELVQIRSINPGYPGTDYEAEVGGETKANQYLAGKVPTTRSGSRPLGGRAETG